MGGKGLIKVIIIIIILALAFVGAMFLFTGGPEEPEVPEVPEENITEPEPTPTVSQVMLSFTGLEALAQGHYEGWAIYGEEKVSTGKFNVGDDLTFSLPDREETPDKIVITIEAEGDTDDLPSGIVILAGDVVDNSATLAFPADLSGVSGNYILTTPTTGDDTLEESGIWFLTLPPPPTAGLVLPELGDGWVYEGWAVNQDTPLSTGKFTSPEGSDQFDGYSATAAAGPPFPGEDFLENAPEGVTFPVNLSDGQSKAVISVEPDLNGEDPTGPGPFSIKPLVADIPAGALIKTNYGMDQNLVTVPSGTAALS